MGPSLYSPIAENSINVFILLGLGGGVGFFAGLCGVGGGFLMTPLLTMIGIPPTIAAASDSNQIVASAASGTYAHSRLGGVDFKMGLFLFAGGMVGSTGGVRIVGLLKAQGHVDFIIRILYVVLLGSVGAYMMAEGISCLRKKKTPDPVEQPLKPFVWDRFLKVLPWPVRFGKSGITLSPLLPLAIGALVGMVAAILGVGGGFIMLPTMCYVLRMPMRVVVGTNLFQELLVCANVTVLQATENQTVDMVLALVLLAGSTVGAQFGARLGHKLNADYLKIIFASVVLIIMVKIFLELVIAPDLMLMLKGDQ
ncbi:MAG: sulfite exporter TauE/SafE family protein [Deltaproteobacteria bacterium]|nr:sulfite exporter TauE/SafE family protein [Deltaproteobacteria bacterium]